jgi:hypothetical protein
MKTRNFIKFCGTDYGYRIMKTFIYARSFITYKLSFHFLGTIAKRMLSDRLFIAVMSAWKNSAAIGRFCFVKFCVSNLYYNISKYHDLVYKSDKSDRNLIRIPTYICVTCLYKGDCVFYQVQTETSHTFVYLKFTSVQQYKS